MAETQGRLSVWLFLFGFCFAFFQVMPAFIAGMWRYPISRGDALDFLTPLGVIPFVMMVWTKVKRNLPEGGPSRLARLAAMSFLVMGAIEYIDGHGIHLPSNSLSRLLEEGTSVYRAAYLYDEVISHYIWDGGMILISAGLILLAARLTPRSLARTDYVLLAVGAAFFGFTFTVDGIEGQTVPMTFPFAAVGCTAALVLYLKERRRGSANPVLTFFSIGYLVSIVLFTYWGSSHPGFPEFSALGWIK
jgi:hypothetical protein